MLSAEKIKCVLCNKEFDFINNTHLKTHGISIREYKIQYPNASTKSVSLRKKCGDATRNKTYLEIYGKEKATYLKDKRSVDALKQMESIDQRFIRKIKCGLPEFYTLDRKLNMSNGITEEVKLSRKNTFLSNFESGKFINKKVFGRQSTQALLYIKDYIKKNNILDTLCYYDSGGINNMEYYSVVFNPIINKKRSIAYDLVITSDSKHDIQTIIEINGPWHYRLKDIKIDPNSPACPLKSNKMTKLESYNIDALKLNKALDISKEVFIFWLDTKKLQKIKKPIKLIY